MATYDCEVVQAVLTLGEDIGALPVPSHTYLAMPDTDSAEGIGSDRGGIPPIRDIPLLVRDLP